MYTTHVGSSETEELSLSVSQFPVNFDEALMSGPHSQAGN